MLVVFYSVCCERFQTKREGENVFTCWARRNRRDRQSSGSISWVRSSVWAPGGRMGGTRKELEGGIKGRRKTGRGRRRERGRRRRWWVEKGTKRSSVSSSNTPFPPALLIQRGNICLHNYWATIKSCPPTCLFLVCGVAVHLSGCNNQLVLQNLVW